MKIIKYIIIPAILAGVIYGIYIYSSHKNTSPQTASETVSAFYKIYQDCLKNPPQEASGQVSVYCQDHTGLTTSDFAKNINAGGIAKLGADPISCAQALPQSFLVSNDKLNDKNTATALVKEFFGSQNLEIRVNLKKINNIWKIDNIMCPRPDPASQPEIIDSWATYADSNHQVSFKYPISAGSNFPPNIKTAGANTQISFQEIGSEFAFAIQPVKPGTFEYFENSIFQESDQIGSIKWDVSLSMSPPFVAYQTTKDNVQYIFVFTHETEKNELQRAILSTFQFLDLKEATVAVKIGESKNILGISIAPQEVLEDSRCPNDVQCIQAGTVRLRTLLGSGMGTAPQIFTLGKIITTETEEIMLAEVMPAPTAGKTIEPGEYQFTFKIKKR